MTDQSPEELQRRVEEQREQLAETIDALSAKLDVKAQARSKAEELRDRATNADGTPRPEVLAAAAVVLVVLVIWWRKR